MRHLSRLSIWLFLACPFAWSAQPTIACSFTIPADWVQNLCGTEAKVHSLAGPNTDLHEFQPGPATARAVLSADLIVGIDPMVEPWLDELVKSNHLSSKVIWLGLPWISATQSGDHPPHTCDTHKGNDPHLWTDPVIVQAMMETLATACSKVAGINPTLLAARKKSYMESIQRLHTELGLRLSKIPAAQRVVITHHNNFSRFAQCYGIKVAGVILESSSTEAADPSAKNLARLIELVRTERVTLVICDRGERAPAAKLLARETGLPPPVSLNLDSLDKPGTPGDTWLGMMNELARALTDEWGKPR